MVKSSFDAKVMIVDDEPMLRRMLSAALTYLGYAVVAAEDARQAMELLESGQRVDLMLTDVVMPNGSGCELARRARKHAPKLKILFMSGRGPDLAEAHVIGSDLLLKPFHLHDLKQRIAAALAPAPSVNFSLQRS